MSRDRERFERLFADYADAVYRYALRRVAAGQAEDVVAETFLIAWRRLGDVPSDGARPWLFTTARWVIKNVRRAERRRTHLIDRVAENRSEPSDPGERITDHLLVRRAFATLSEGDQEVLRLTEWDGLGRAEAARIVGCSESTYGVRLHRARRRLTVALPMRVGDLTETTKPRPEAR